VHLVVQALIIGVLTGGVYALMATGQTLIFGVMKVINVAQGAMVIMGAYLAYSLFTVWGVDPFLAVVLTTPAMFALGVGLHWAFLRRLHHDQAQLSLLVLFAAALAIEGFLNIVYHSTSRSTQPGYANHSWTIASYQVSEVRVFAFALSLAILGGLYLLLGRTRFGRSVRATVQNPMSAVLLGVDTDRVAAIGFGVGAATAAAAGAVYGIVYPFNPGSHYDLISRLLSIVVLGGLGSIGGAVAAAVLMGVAEAVVSVEISPSWAGFTFFVVLLVVLLTRPRGLFGRAERGAL
jgi:branched-chain amino acid transport system permease protein